MRVLFIEDEESISSIVKRGLEEEGLKVDLSPDGISGLQLARKNIYSTIILDLMIPGMSGEEVCKELRAQKIQTPIIILTARGEVDDRIRGLELGADDYLPKPFDLNELSARVKALIRRDKVNRGRVIVTGRLKIDTKTKCVWCNSSQIALTNQEYLLIEALARHESRTLTREFITEVIWLNHDSYSNSVDVHIASLRRKIDQDHSQKLIHTVFREGYVLKCE